MAMADWFDQQGFDYSTPGGPSGDIVPLGNDNWAVGGESTGVGPADPNDPFAYTGGSLLTPWSKAIPTAPVASGGGISMDPFSYKDFNYSTKAPGDYAAAAPITAGQVQAGTINPLSKFTAPTLDETNDPGYAFRLKEGQRAIQNQASKQGARGGDVMKAFEDYAQNYASGEYSNLWQRAFNTWGQENANDLNVQGANVSNKLAADTGNADRSMNAQQADAQNLYALYGIQQNAENTGLAASTGAYDRNRQNASDMWNSAFQINSHNASAGAGNDATNYARQMQQYGLEHDLFEENQSNQWNRLTQLAGIGNNAQANLSGAGGQYYDAYGNLVTGQANANAAGAVGGANAYGSLLNTAGALALYGGTSTTKKPPVTPPTSGLPPLAPIPAGGNGYW